MLEEIEIHGVGGIQKAHLNFTGKFNVITGESGTGKSSFVRALEFITGVRVKDNIIHTSEEKCEVNAVITSKPVAGLPESLQPEDSYLYVKRIFSRTGKGRAYLQNQPVPLSSLSLALERNIVIQSQFAQLNLLNQQNQMDLVDSCGGKELSDILIKLEKTFAEALKAEREIVALKKRRNENAKLYDKAPEIIRQIKALDISNNDENTWNNELYALEKMETRQRVIRIILDDINNPETGIADKIERVITALYDNFDDKDSKLKTTAESALSNIQQLSRFLYDLGEEQCSKQEIEDEKDKIEKKLGVLRKIKRLLNLQTTEELNQYIINAENELAWISQSRIELEKLEQNALNLRHETSRLAMLLRTMRTNAAKILSERVNSHLKELAMGEYTFNIELEKLDKIKSNGADNVNFTLALPDQRPLPIGKNASGGELSRILIAIQLSIGDDKLPETIVFDEVEAGLGGKTALLAGYKLRNLADRCHTILITHQATIAAMADCHYVVKRVDGNTVITNVEGQEREHEIARMLSGNENSKEAIQHARALLNSEKNQVR